MPIVVLANCSSPPAVPATRSAATQVAASHGDLWISPDSVTDFRHPQSIEAFGAVDAVIRVGMTKKQLLAEFPKGRGSQPRGTPWIYKFYTDDLDAAADTWHVTYFRDPPGMGSAYSLKMEFAGGALKTLMLQKTATP